MIAQNYRCRFGEIDIIAACQDVLCFIEVKTRSSVKYGAPCEAVDHKKRLHMRRCAWAFVEDIKKGKLNDPASMCDEYGTDEAMFWLKERQWSSLRLEIIEVLYVGEKFYIRHIKDLY